MISILPNKQIEHDRPFELHLAELHKMGQQQPLRTSGSTRVNQSENRRLPTTPSQSSEQVPPARDESPPLARAGIAGMAG